MEIEPPQSLQTIFVLLTFILLAVTVLAVRKISEERKIAMKTFIIIFFWLSFLKIISGMNFMHNYSSMPPRLMIAPLGCFIAIIVLAASKKFSGFLKNVPMHWLIYIQSFRIVMEVVLYQLAQHGIIHERMTFAGSNFDILTGITAIPMGYLVQRNKISKNGLLAWNIFGIVLLLNIVSIALLSTPYPFSIFKDAPVNTIVFYFPFIWLPGFVAPFALAMHVFSIKKAVGEGKKGESSGQ